MARARGDSMPRNSPSIKLTRRERAELVRRSTKYRSEYRDVIRAKIVLLAGKGLANDVIGARLDSPRQQVAPARFSPGVIVEVKALACELPSRRGLPLARRSLAELRREVVAQGQWHHALAL